MGKLRFFQACFSNRTIGAMEITFRKMSPINPIANQRRFFLHSPGFSPSSLSSFTSFRNLFHSPNILLTKFILSYEKIYSDQVYCIYLISV